MVRELEHQDQLQSMVFRFLKEYRIAQLLKQSNVTKQAGIAVLDVFRAIFSLVFTQRSLNRWLKQSGGNEFGKDTVYRFLNSPRYTWLVGRQLLCTTRLLIAQFRERAQSSVRC